MTSRFQGIARRTSPSAGLGYELLDRPDVSWDVTVGAGWQWTEYVGVLEDGSSSDDEGTGVIITHLEWDVTGDVARVKKTKKSFLAGVRTQVSRVKADSDRPLHYEERT